jgi:hypothetical protein
MSETSAPGRDEPSRFEIRVKGHLESRWAAWFDGLSLTQELDGTTIIAGTVPDQAALHGLLQKLRDVGVPLVSVTPVDREQNVPASDPHSISKPHTGA